MSLICGLITQLVDGLLRFCGRKRVVVLMGAGASIEYKAPSTPDLTSAIEGNVMTDALMKGTGADAASLPAHNWCAGRLFGCAAAAVASRRTVPCERAWPRIHF
jgi:hypothetical protein